MKKIKRLIEKYKTIILLSVLLILTTVFLVLFFDNKLVNFDYTVINYIKNNLRSDGVITFMKIITFFGSSFFLIGLSFLGWFFIKNKKVSFLITLNLFTAFIFNRILKYAIQRPRPVDMLVEEKGFSFPSGHAMISTAFFGFLIYLIVTKIKNQNIKFLLISIILILLILICFSRIYLGVHYPTDVIGGVLFSTIYLVLFIDLNILQNNTKVL